MSVSLEALRAIAVERTADLPAGAPLDAATAALVSVGLAASVGALAGARLETAIATAFAAGVTTAQLEEIVALVSGLGVHSLMVAAPLILAAARARGESVTEGPLDAARQALWDEKVGHDRYWAAFEREVPGFLDALLRLSAETFRAFFDYCALPWRGGLVPPRTKELVAMAVDAAPGHRFGPGFRLHLGNALKLGACRRAIFDALDLAAACPAHSGFA
jgi:alkylhydroperoxidase/carboxymuconolactone decarboxylase family protein YurZ